MIPTGLLSKFSFKPLRRAAAVAAAAAALAGPASAYELLSPNENANGAFGQSVARIPDVTGDGVSDIAVGAPGNNPGTSPSRSGRVYIYEGKTGLLLRTLDSPTKTVNGLFGAAVAGVADADGDGYGDVIVGAPGEPSPATPTVFAGSGRVYLFSGATGQLLLTLTSPVPSTSGQFGASVAEAPDATGDGFGDIIVGAPFEELAPSPNNSGRAYLFDGTNGAIVRQWAAPNPGGLGSGNFGNSVAGLGDVNADLRTDILIGAPNEEITPSPNNSGRAYIFDAATGAQLFMLVSPAEFFGGKFGVAVAAMPDVTSDGIPEVLIGEEFGAGGTGPAPGGPGQAHIFNPVTGTWLRSLSSPVPLALARFGTSVGGGIDFTGDARGDALVGSRLELTTGIISGRAASFNGATGANVTAYPAQNPVANGLYGLSLTGLDDLDGDLRGDIIIGAPGEAPNASPLTAGRAHVYSGASGATIPAAPPTLVGTTCYVDPVGDTAGYLTGGGWGTGVAPHPLPPAPDPSIDMSEFCINDSCAVVSFKIELGLAAGALSLPHAQIGIDLPITGPVPVPGTTWYDPNAVMSASGVGLTGGFTYDILLITDVASNQLYAVRGFLGAPVLVPGGVSTYTPGIGGNSSMTVSLPWAVLGALFTPGLPTPTAGMVMGCTVMTAHSANSLSTGITGAPATDPDDVLSNFTTAVELKTDLSTDFQVFHVLSNICPTPTPIPTDTPSPTPTTFVTLTPPASPTPSPTDTPTAVVGFDQPNYLVTEGDGTVQVKVTLQGGSILGPVLVYFSTSDGSARALFDYVGSPLLLQFNPGDTEQIVTIPIVDDLIPEGLETFVCTLSTPSGAVLGLRTTTVTIKDNDDPFGLRETVAAYPGEGRDPGQFGKVTHDLNGNLHVAYWEAESQDLKYAFGLRDTLTGEVAWQIQTVDTAGDVGRYLDITVDRNNLPFISYHDATNGSLKVAYDLNGNGDFEQTSTVPEVYTLDSGSARTGLWTSVTTDNTNAIHLSYQDQTNGDLRYAFYNGAWNFETVTRGAPRVGAYSSIVVDNTYLGSGYVIPYIFYQDDYTLDLRAAWRLPVFGWREIGVIDSEGDTGLYIDTAITDDNRKIYVSYQDAMTTTPGLSRAKLYSYTDSYGTSYEEVRACTPTGLDPCQRELLFGDFGFYTSVAADGNGFAQVAHYDNFNGNMIVDRRTTDSIRPYSPVESTWQPRRRSDTKGDVGLFTSSDHHQYRAPSGIRDVIDTTLYDFSHKAFRMATATNDVLTSERAQYIDGAKVGEYSALALDSLEHSFIAYYDNPAGALYIKGKQGPPGTPFGTPILVDDSTASRSRAGDALGNNNSKVSRADFAQTGLYASMVIDPNDKAHVAYYDRLRRELNYSVVDLATSTSQRIGVDEGFLRGQYSSIAMSRTGTEFAIAYYQELDTLHVADAVGPGPRLRVAVGDGFTSGGWDIQSVDNVGDVGRYCSITYGPANSLHVAYHDSTNLSLKYATNNGLGGSWLTETVDQDPDFNVVGYDTSIAINPQNGDPCIAYYDLTSARLKFAEKINGIWQIEVVDEVGDVGKAPDLKFDPVKRLAYILYYDATFEALKIAVRPFAGASFQRVTTIETGGAGAEPSLAVDSNGQIRMSYYDVKNGDLIYRHALADLFSAVEPATWSQYE